MFRIEEIELGMENTIGITLESCVGVQRAILHVCHYYYYYYYILVHCFSDPRDTKWVSAKKVTVV